MTPFGRGRRESRRLDSTTPACPPNLAMVPAGPCVDDSKGYIIYSIGATLKAAVLALAIAAAAEGVTNRRAPGWNIAGVTFGVAVLFRWIIGSRTLHDWADWYQSVIMEREDLSQQRDQRRLAIIQTGVAAQTIAAASSQPTANELAVNETVARILRDYYAAQTRGERPVKLWSRRNLEKLYGIGEYTSVNERVRQALDRIADGDTLRPAHYEEAYRALFGMAPGIRTLERIGDNPARQEAILALRPAVVGGGAPPYAGPAHSDDTGYHNRGGDLEEDLPCRAN